MFDLTTNQQAIVADWRKQQEELVRAQKKLVDAYGEPYYGAIGGAVTYSFTPTSLGNIVKVHHAGTTNELDISEYDLW